MRRIHDYAQQLLFVDWMRTLCDREFDVKQSGSGTAPDGQRSWTVALSDETEVKVRFVGKKSTIVTECDPKHRKIVTSLEREAFQLTKAQDYGEGAWWKLVLSVEFGLTEFMGVHFMRFLDERKRYQGRWRIGDDCFLEFAHDNPEPQTLELPKFSVSVVYRVPSPGHGPFGSDLAGQFGTLVRSLVSFASGVPVDGAFSIFPAKDDEVQDWLDRNSRREVPEMFVDDVLLGPHLSALITSPDEVEAFRRAQGALYSYEQALRQDSEFVTIVLLVTAIEALSVPNQDWRLRRTTKRFVEFLKQACPEKIQEVMAHRNFSVAFGPKTSQSKFLHQIYEMRSVPLHTGLTPHFVSAIPMSSQEPAIRVMLISGLAREAIKSFLRSPFSSLIGHPIFDPDPASATS